MARPAADGNLLQYEIGTMVLSGVGAPGLATFANAAAWQNRVRRLGLHVPFFAVHDLGVLVTRGDEVLRGQAGLRIGTQEAWLTAAGADSNVKALCDLWVQTLRVVAESEIAARASAWGLGDDLVAVILTKVLRGLVSRWTDRATISTREELPVDARFFQGTDVVGAWRAHDRRPALSFLRLLAEQRLFLLTSFEQIDLDTLRVLGMLGETEQASFMDVADLLAVFSSSEANDVVNFSLDLLPSVLETKRTSGAQTFAVDGYASVERKGHVDQLVLSEMAHDDEVFWHKFAENELLFYGREKSREERRRLHYVAVDASASMRGVRTVFARGLALTLMKKLSLLGERVWFRFFDSRLHELMRVTKDSLQAPYLLSFRSERGRNYSKVYQQLATEVARLRKDEGGQVTLYLITHGQAHVPTEAVENLKRSASLYGVFILPSHDVDLEYLPLLDRYHVIDEATLSSRMQRRTRALEIVEEVAERAERRAGGSPVQTARATAWREG